MKKLFTFLLAISLSVTVFGEIRTWNHASSPTGGDWQVTTNWIPNGLPSAGDEIYFLCTLNTMTVTNIPNVTIDHLFVERASGDAGSRILNFESTSGTETITFAVTVTSTHLYDVTIAPRTTLNCNVPFKKVKVVCNPGIRFRVEAVGSSVGVFIPAYYDPCSEDRGFVLKANASSHAELIQMEISGNPISGWQEFYLPIDKFHYFSSPVPSTFKVPATNLTCRKANCLCFLDGNYVRKYDVGLQDWGSWMGSYGGDCVSTELDFTIGLGYEVYSKQTRSEVYGTFNTFPTLTNLPVSATGGQWSLLGNPFASGLRFNGNDGTNVIGWSWDKTTVSPWVCYWSNITGETFYYNWSANPPVAIPAQGPSNPTPDIIPRSQGFFVYTIEDNAELQVSNMAREFSCDKQIGKATSELATNQLYLKLTDGVNSPDYSVVWFNENGSANYDQYDMLKLFINSPDKSEIYCKKADNKEVVLNTLNESNDNTIVPVYMNVGKTGTYTITADQVNTFSSYAGILLKDNKTNVTVNLKATQSYTFDAVNGDDPGRFTLLFKDVLGVNTLTGNSLKLYSSGNTIYIQNSIANEGGIVTVYDLVGRPLLTENLSESSLTRITTSFIKGFYIVSVKTDKGLLTEKVYLN